MQSATKKCHKTTFGKKWTWASVALSHRNIKAHAFQFQEKSNFAVIILGRTIGASLSPMAHENMTYGPKCPVIILDGAKFYPACAEIKNIIFQFSTQACCEKISGISIYTRTILSELDSKVCLSFNLMHEIINKVSCQLFDAYPAKI